MKTAYGLDRRSLNQKIKSALTVEVESGYPPNFASLNDVRIQLSVFDSSISYLA